MTKEKPTPKKDTLKEISEDLRSFDFTDFDPRKNKMDLMQSLQAVNSKLGKLLGGFPS